MVWEGPSMASISPPTRRQDGGSIALTGGTEVPLAGALEFFKHLGTLGGG